MITKVRRFKNIGKFYDFSEKANALDWHKNIFVFAPNAYGKTSADWMPKILFAIFDRHTAGTSIAHLFLLPVF